MDRDLSGREGITEGIDIRGMPAVGWNLSYVHNKSGIGINGPFYR